MQQVTVIGAGILGSQIAFQCAYHGKDVVIHDSNPEVLSGLASRWEYFIPLYLRDLPDTTTERLKATIKRISGSHQLTTAVQDADVIIEAVPEILEVKQATWSEASEHARTDAILLTNSSTLLPSAMATAVKGPARFLALHFTNEIWRFNIGEVMGHAGTDPSAIERTLTFAQEIGIRPIALNKEQPGYVINSLLVPLMTAASKLYLHDVADFRDIDVAWKQGTGAPMGPFEIYDIIGMETPYNLNSRSDDPELREFAQILKRDFIDTGRLGRSVGRGFYDYPEVQALLSDV